MRVDGPVVVLAGGQLLAVATLAAAGAAHSRQYGRALTGVELAAVAELDSAARAVVADQQRRQARQGQAGEVEVSWLTAADLADQLGVSVRTVQRRAAAYGGRRARGDTGRWLFPPHLRETERPP